MTEEERLAAEKAAAEKAAAEKAAAEKAAAEKAAAEAANSGQDNETNKYRRLAEKHEKEANEAKAKLKEIEDAKLTDAERLQKEADQAKAENAQLKQEKLRNSIATEAGLSADLAEFLSGDETAMRAQAQKLAANMKPDTQQAGTHTQPARGQQPTIDERIAAAQKKGNAVEAIRLKREKAGYTQ